MLQLSKTDPCESFHHGVVQHPAPAASLHVGVVRLPTATRGPDRIRTLLGMLKTCKWVCDHQSLCRIL